MEGTRRECNTITMGVLWMIVMDVKGGTVNNGKAEKMRKCNT